MRKVWVEISAQELRRRIPWSPSARKVWIEIMQKVWIETGGI